jgi:hypothetical protein
MTDSFGNTTALVKGLTGASLGVGVTELLAPGKVAALRGVDDTKRTRRVIQALGARECGHGAALLRGPDKLVWTRVAGDLLDLTLLGAGVAATDGRGRRRRGTIAAAALSGVAGIDLTRHYARHATALREHEGNHDVKRVARQENRHFGGRRGREGGTRAAACGA